MSAMKKFSDMRNGYFSTVRIGGTPLARAVMTYCFFSSSSRLARMRRIMAAVPDVPMTMTGMIMCSSTDPNLAQLIGSLMYLGSIRPPIDVPNHTLAKYIITRASRKLGVASPIRPRNVKP